MVTRPRKRADDKAPRRYRSAIHYFAGIAIGWHLRGWFPDHARFIDLVGDGWDWFLGALQGLGGTAVVISAVIALFNVYRWHVERNTRGN